MATEKSYRILESTKKLIEQTVEQVLGARLGSDSQGGGRGHLQGRDSRSDHYIVKTPAEGIPAADLGATPPKIGGSVNCYVYQINSNRELVQTSRQELVWNPGDSDIDGDTFIQITRDKFGRWLPLISGSPANTIIVQPRDICAGIGDQCACVSAEVVLAPCGGSPAVGSLQTVWDSQRHWFNLPMSVLETTNFIAQKFQNDGTFVTPEDPYGVGCVWVVTGMQTCRENTAPLPS